MSLTIHQGDALTVLRTLPDESVHCCVTSPPYWGLRDYGTPGQIGLEATPAEYVGRLVEVFREVRRVLRSDGTCWMNMGDSYQGSGLSGGKKPSVPGTLSFRGAIGRGRIDAGLKPKDLCGIPWRLAFALQDDGWWLRSDIIWSKPNPMPESVTDRPTKAHEYIFLLAKSAKYYYDAEAIKEPSSPDSHARYARGRSDTHKWADGGPGNQTIAKSFEHMRPAAGWHQGTRAAGSAPRDKRAPGVNPKAAEPGSGIRQNSSFSAAVKDLVESRNKRSVWTVPTQPTPEAHFATYPIALIEPCILAGCPEGGTVLDPFCGAGTTGMAALKHGRCFVGIELNPEYIKIANERLHKHMPLFAQVTA